MMSEVGFEISSRKYRVNCDDGQENHIKNLARALDAKAQALEKISGTPIAESRLMMLVALTLADEYDELQKKMAESESEIRDLRIKLASERGKASNNGWKNEVSAYHEDIESVVADLLINASKQLENLANRFDFPDHNKEQKS